MAALVPNALLAGVLQGAELEVQSEALPPLKYNLAELTEQAPPGWLTRWLRPTIIIRRQGVELLRSSPAGATDPEAWKVTVGVTLAVVLALLLVVGLLSR